MIRHQILDVTVNLCMVAFVFLIAAFYPIHGDTLVKADDANINYYGRFDFTDPAKPRFNWSGAIIEASFPGPAIGMQIDHVNAFYDIEIDGMLDTVISTGSEKDFIFRKNLSPQNHTVRIILRSENHLDVGIFSGLILADGKQLAPPPAKPARKIEFIGDSYTAGYGTESSNRTCNSEQLRKYTNTNRTFAAQITRRFHAQSIILGWSGAGMVRNYNESSKRSAAPFPAHYQQTLGEAGSGGNWDYSKWIPELVVICLGTNDYSTVPHPDDSMYIGDYHKFIARVLGNYPDASILCVSTGDLKFEKNVKQVVAEETTALNHPNVYFAPFPPSLALTACHWHPSMDDNNKVAKALVDTIIKIMDWDTTATVAHLPSTPVKNGRAQSKLTWRTMNGQLEVSLVTRPKSALPLTLIRVSGEVISQGVLNAKGLCTFRREQWDRGVYLAGNAEIGWVRAMVRH